MAVFSRFRKALNAFLLYENTPQVGSYNQGPSTTVRPYTVRPRFTNERSIVSSIYTRIAIDFAGIDIKHVKLDAKGRYLEDMKSTLNRCFSLEANIDQGPTAFKQDLIMSLFDGNGAIAIVPVNMEVNEQGKIINILDLRIGAIVDWRPRHVRVSLYNEDKGIREEIVLEKRHVAIVENPLYSVMNEPNSTLQRLIRKLNYLDVIDEQTSSGKLDIIVQVPYAIKSEAKRQQADARRTDLEFQLRDSKYGIAYTDSTEKIVQLNRPAENNLLKQVEYLVDMLYGQLGITAEVMNGTADEKTMLNYINRTIKPLHDATAEAMQRAFLGVQGTENNERIRYFRNPFALVPLAEVANIADKFSRNEILSPNEIRGFIGIPPSDDPKADKLINSNMPQKPELEDPSEE